MCNFVINYDTLEDVEKCWETMRDIEIYNFQKFPSDHVTDITDYRDAIASKNIMSYFNIKGSQLNDLTIKYKSN